MPKEQQPGIEAKLRALEEQVAKLTSGDHRTSEPERQTEEPWDALISSSRHRPRPFDADDPHVLIARGLKRIFDEVQKLTKK